MTVRIIDFMGDRDGIRWGHAVSPDAPTDSHHFMWTYDALNDVARVFAAPCGQQMVAEEFEASGLRTRVRMAVRERLGLPA